MSLWGMSTKNHDQSVRGSCFVGSQIFEVGSQKSVIQKTRCITKKSCCIAHSSRHIWVSTLKISAFDASRREESIGMIFFVTTLKDEVLSAFFCFLGPKSDLQLYTKTLSHHEVDQLGKFVKSYSNLNRKVCKIHFSGSETVGEQRHHWITAQKWKIRQVRTIFLRDRIFFKRVTFS
jgi:hypothetical protein